MIVASDMLFTELDGRTRRNKDGPPGQTAGLR